MILLRGKLRQRGKLNIKGNDRLKLVVEHETPRESGPPDLNLETLFLEPHWEPQLPADGSFVTVQVRPYPSGRNVAYAALAVVPPEKGAA
jgi:hypothetical protein